MLFVRRVRLNLRNSLSSRQKKTSNWLSTLDRRASSAGVALIDTADRVLVVKAKYKRYWSFPGGIIDVNETPLRAAVREVKEEVGLDIDPTSLLFGFVVSRQSGIALTYQFVFYGSVEVTNASTIVLDGKEIEAYEFVTREQILAHDRKYSQSTVLWAKGFDKGYSEQSFSPDGQP